MSNALKQIFCVKSQTFLIYINRNSSVYALKVLNFDLPSTLSPIINPFCDEQLQIYIATTLATLEAIMALCLNWKSLDKDFFQVQITLRRADVAAMKLKMSARSLDTMVCSHSYQ